MRGDGKISQILINGIFRVIMYLVDLIIVAVFITMIHFDKWQASKAKCPEYCAIDHKCNKDENK